MLFTAPLVRGGNRPLPLMVMELVSLAGLGLMFWRAGSYGSLLRGPREVWLAMLILAGYAVLQLIPLPPRLWQGLAGRELYREALLVLDPALDGTFQPISLHAWATEQSCFALLPPLVGAMMIQTLHRHQIGSLMRWLLLAGLVQASLGILQVGSGPESLLYFGNSYGAHAATGTYVNKNHLAGLLAMLIPLAVAVWTLALKPRDSFKEDPSVRHGRTDDTRAAQRVIWSAAMVVLLLALLLTRSRAGIACGLLAASLTLLVFMRERHSMGARIGIALIAAIAFSMALVTGLTPMLEPLQTDALSIAWSGRWNIARVAMQAGDLFFPWGSGLGTFNDVFARFQTPELPGYIEHAHNDYVEAYVELGLPGLIVMGLLLFAFLRRALALLRRPPVDTLSHLQYGAGLGVFALLLHGMVDFNFHIPANALVFGVLCGVFVYEPRDIEVRSPVNLQGNDGHVQ
jgi:O-antigen ligase